MKITNFLDKEFRAFCQQEYDKARYYLKTCGKPKTQEDIWYIKFNKETEKIMYGFLSC